MAGTCKPCAAGAARRATFRTPSSGSADAAQAGGSPVYEVVNAAGEGTGRTFDSLVAATGYARRIGGTTRPA